MRNIFKKKTVYLLTRPTYDPNSKIDNWIVGNRLDRIEHIVNKAIKEHRYKKAVNQISQLFKMEELK